MACYGNSKKEISDCLYFQKPQVQVGTINHHQANYSHIEEVIKSAVTEIHPEQMYNYTICTGFNLAA